MATEIKMPQLGESVVEGTITKWLKHEGDTIEEDELLVEVSTDKVDSEIPSSAGGTIEKILVQEGETVKVGTPIAVVAEGGASGSQAEAAQPAQEQAAEQPEPAPAKEPARQEAAEAPPEEQPAPAAEDGAEPAQAEGQGQETPERGAPAADDRSKRGIISPLVRRLADEHGVDLDALEGTGTGGRIRKQDVLKFVETQKAKPAAKPAAQAEEAPEERAEPKRQEHEAPVVVGGEGAREELVPWTNIRRRTAEHMVASHLETARAWNAVEADWTNIVELRQKAKEGFKAREGFNLTFTPFLAKMLCDTLLEMPEVNSTFDEEQQGNVIKRYVHLGIAVALEGGGLIVPVVKAADEKNLVGVARGINEIVLKARSKKLAPDDLAGGTFTITNPGPFGSIISVPIIPRGQSGIVGFEAIEKRVVVMPHDQIAIRSMGFLSMSWDHRAIDGAEAARFLARLKERVESTDFSSELQQYF